jgi:hypothetical protein
VLFVHKIRFQNRLGQLFDVKRHPIGLANDVFDDLGGQYLAAGLVHNQRLRLRPLQPVKSNRSHV